MAQKQIKKYFINYWSNCLLFLATAIKSNRFILRLLLVVIFLILGFLFGAAKIAQANDANLKAGPYGPNISVGLKEYSRTYLKEHSFKISANKKFNVKNRNGEIIAAVPADTDTKVKYDGDKYFRVYESIPETEIYKQITFDSADGNNDNIIFDINLPDYSYDHYRGKIRLRYAEIEDEDDKIWVINIPPLEQYVWGLGEITGTGDADYNRTMTTAARTYGYWKIKYSTAYAAQGFKVNATPGNQLYYGYDWEKDHPRIKQAAQYTQGKIVMYEDEIALPPYSSWTDGKTRRYEDGHWGGICHKITGTISKIYPWMSSVSDPYGKNPDKSTCTLAKEGNHMVGISAHGALHLAGSHDWSWSKILKYYLRDVSISTVYPK